MGFQWLGITTTITMLKSTFFVAALVAAVHAEADADADAYYSTLGYHGLGYTNYGLRSYAAPYAFGVRSYGYAGPYTYGAYRHFGKRSADAEPEPEADADAYYSTLGYHGLGYSNYGYNGLRSYAAPAYGYRSYGHGYASPYNYGAYRHFGKRSAEAEAKPEADAFYNTLGYNGLGYANYGYNGYRSYVAPAYTRSFGYASPYAYNYGAYRHFGKRSADAEPEAEADADADAYYSALGYHGLGYANYGYNGFRSYVAPAYTRSFGYASPYA